MRKGESQQVNNCIAQEVPLYMLEYAGPYLTLLQSACPESSAGGEANKPQSCSKVKVNIFVNEFEGDA